MLTPMNDFSEKNSSAILAKTVRCLVQKVQLLQNAVTDKKTVSQVALEQQRQAMAKLKNLALKEPIGVMGYVTACCVTKTNLNQVFDFQYMPFPSADGAILKAFFEPQNIFALFQKYQVLKRVDLPVFTADFPDLGQKPFSPRLYDVLNDTKDNSLSFSNELAFLFKERYFQLNSANIIEKREKHRLQNVIEELAQKNYPSMQLLAAQIAERNREPSVMKEWFNALLRNKYGSKEQVNRAREALHFIHRSRNPFQKSSFAKSFERNG